MPPAQPPPPTFFEPNGASDETTIAARVMVVTPEKAELWLTKNHPENRPISWRVVESYAGDMRNGAWRLTHQAICFDGAGLLIDGQHRLHALKAAGVAVTMLVIKNSKGGFHDPIDRLRPRSIGVIMGSHPRDVAALNTLRMFEAGYHLHTSMTLADAEAVAERHKADWNEVQKIPNRSKLPGPVIGACVWAWPCHPVATAAFMRSAISGEHIGRGDPAYAFRVWRERNTEKIRAWEAGLAALNCLRYQLTGMTLATVYTGDNGYRAICSQRRALGAPHTPGEDVVPRERWIPKQDGPPPVPRGGSDEKS